jgi:gluconolactonase
LTVCAADFDIRNAAEWKRIVPADAKLQKLAGDMGFLEGPVWINKDGGFLVFSDIRTNELKRWTAKDGVTTFRKESGAGNGNALDRAGRLITCEGGARRLSILEKSGELKTLVDQFDGKKFNAPNDVVVKSDGSVWFTDPDYGLAKEKKEQPGNFVFRFNPKDKSLVAVAKDFNKPNGLCFSPDEKKLFVADTATPKQIRVFDVQKDGALAGGKSFCTIDKGVPDGIRCDAKGRIWSSADDGVQIFSPGGELIGKILVPESPANLCFGGKDGKTLFVTARKSLYSIPVLVKAAKRP